jgi:hypothetical protein
VKSNYDLATNHFGRPLSIRQKIVEEKVEGLQEEMMGMHVVVQLPACMWEVIMPWWQIKHKELYEDRTGAQ